MILYYDCDGSLFGRNAINDRLAVVGFQWIDCTGGQAAFEDGDLEAFGRRIVEAARELGVKIYNILRIDDPGLGLMISPIWLQEGLESKKFQRFPIPEDVYARPEKINLTPDEIAFFKNAPTPRLRDPTYVTTLLAGSSGVAMVKDDFAHIFAALSGEGGNDGGSD